MKKDTAFVRILSRYVLLTAIAGALVLFFTRVVRVNHTTVAFAFLIMVLLAAYRWRLAYSVYASVLCTLLFNIFFLPPVGRLTIADPQNWIALGAFLCTSVMVSHLSDRELRHAESSEARRRDVELLYRLSQALLIQDDPKELARSTPSILASVFGFRAVALYVGATDAAFYSDPDQILASSTELRLADADSDSAVSEENGLVLIHLRLGMHHSLGCLAITGAAFAREMYEAIGSLVSVALERAAALERTSRLEAARESERLRSALVDSVTHDLRTPLTAIRAAATTLQSLPALAEAERNDLIAVVDEESAQLDRLIGQAVEMATLDSQSLRLELQPLNFREFIDQTLERLREMLQERPIEIRAPDHLPIVWADRVLLERVLQHLLENAVAYSKPGAPISISVEIDSDRLRCSVKDSGPGIAEEDLPFIFDKYFRGRQHKSRRKGTGMGLAIARAMMKVHQGDIDVESRLGEGSNFTFWIPRSIRETQMISSPNSPDSQPSKQSVRQADSG